MRKLLFILALLLPFAADAQDTPYGLTGRFGVFETLVSSSEAAGQDVDYGTGLQLELGAWLRKPVTAKGYLQLALLHAIERQSGGLMRLTDESQTPWADVRTRYGNLAVSASALYVHQLSDKLAVGAGAGARYKYAAVMAAQFPETSFRSSAEPDDYYDNHYHRKLSLHLPLEAQLTLGPQMQLVGQLQVPLSNKIAASESVFKERDLGLSVGVNYRFR